MSKPFYAEYANHAMRFYARHSDCKPAAGQSSDLAMWEACANASKRFTAHDNAVILAVYRSKCRINEAVECISKELRIPENKIWKLINQFSKVFAKERGLI